MCAIAYLSEMKLGWWKSFESRRIRLGLSFAGRSLHGAFRQDLFHCLAKRDLETTMSTCENLKTQCCVIEDAKNGTII